MDRISIWAITSLAGAALLGVLAVLAESGAVGV